MRVNKKKIVLRNTKFKFTSHHDVLGEPDQSVEEFEEEPD